MDPDGWRWADEVVGVCGSSLLIAPILPGKKEARSSAESESGGRGAGCVKRKGNMGHNLVAREGGLREMQHRCQAASGSSLRVGSRV